MDKSLWIAKHYQKKSFLNFKPEVSGITVDLGCGEQPYREYIEHYIGMERYCDLKPDFVGDIQRIPIKTASVDTVLCMEVLEHVPCTADAVSEISRIMKSGAKLYLTVPFYWYVHYPPHDYWRFTPYALYLLLAKRGISITYIERRGGLNYFIAVRLAEFLSTKVPGWFMPVINGILYLYSKLDRFNKRDAAGWIVHGRRV